MKTLISGAGFGRHFELCTG